MELALFIAIYSCSSLIFFKLVFYDNISCSCKPSNQNSEVSYNWSCIWITITYIYSSLLLPKIKNLRTITWQMLNQNPSTEAVIIVRDSQTFAFIRYFYCFMLIYSKLANFIIGLLLLLPFLVFSIAFTRRALEVLCL